MNNNSTLNNNFSIKGTSSNTFSMFKGGYIILVHGSQKLDNIMGSGMTVLFSSTIFVHLFVTPKASGISSVYSSHYIFYLQGQQDPY